MGRPSSYTLKRSAEICERLAVGDSLSAICRDDHMPSMSTVLRWVSLDAEFQERYAQARNIGLEKMADELLALADAPVGVMDNGGTDNGAVNKQRLQVDTRKWILSKLAPKKYGDRQAVEISGSVDIATTIAAARKRSGG